MKRGSMNLSMLSLALPNYSSLTDPGGIGYRFVSAKDVATYC